MKQTNELTTGLSLLSKPAGLATLPNSLGVMSIQRRAGQEITHEQCRALLTYTAMENTMMLSAMEAFCYRTAPFGEQRYKQIVDAYAAGAINRILGW